MSDVKVSDLPSLNVPLKGNSTTVVVQDGATFKSTISSLSSAIYSNVLDNVSSDVPVGVVTFYAASAAPVGWLECDGSTLIKTLYNDLWLAIGNTFTSIPSTDYFKIPDLRGLFVRGWHHNKVGTSEGDAEGNSRIFGSIQQDCIENHTHDLEQILINKTKPLIFSFLRGKKV